MFTRKAFTRFFYSFPIQLVIVLLKKNQILLIYWIFLFGWITNSFSKTFGIPYLFLDPEYMGIVGFTSFFIMGFTTGSFVMVFNISSYIVNGFRFPFIATLSKPFLKYTMNNFIVPVIFVITYISFIISFQLNNEYRSLWAVLSQVIGIYFRFRSDHSGYPNLLLQNQQGHSTYVWSGDLRLGSRMPLLRITFLKKMTRTKGVSAYLQNVVVV